MKLVEKYALILFLSILDFSIPQNKNRLGESRNVDDERSVYS